MRVHPRPARPLTTLFLLSLAAGFSACHSSPSVPDSAAPSPTLEFPGIELMLDQLYDAFCFDAGGEADWNRMRELFAEGASFAGPIRPGSAVRLQSEEGFITDFKSWIANSEVGQTGFHERILSLRIDSFANIAHAYVTFEGFVPGEREAQTLGLDSIQLVLDRGRWKVASFTSQYASESIPMPGRF